MPPARAIAMAIRDSVTVSIAELTSGTLSRIFLVSWLEVSAVAGTTSEAAGSSSTSSKVRPEHRDLVRVVAAGGHRIVGQGADADVRAVDQVGAAFKVSHATRHR